MADDQGGTATADRLSEFGALADYAPGEERPLAGYLVLMSVYAGATGGAAVALRRAGRPLPERVSAGDIVLIGVASHKISRTITKDKVTSFLRAPFTRFQEPSGKGEVEEEPRGHGVHRAVGELLVCPYCVAQWVATGLTLGLVASPRVTRLTSTVFVAHTISDFMQAAYRAVESRA
ncbi:MAG TPA: DUF1360 domain-containing protein [Solirubrobacteraceae bacterium]|jgi:hypothetical protein